MIDLVTTRGRVYDSAEHDQLVDCIRASTGVIREDAEDAAQNAWVKALENRDKIERKPGQLAGFVVTKGRFLALHEKRRRTTRVGSALSLDGLQEDTGDLHLPTSADPIDQVDARITLSALVSDQLTDALIEAQRHGDGYIRPRGENVPNNRLTAQDVEQMRALRREGWTYPRIGRAYGLHKSDARRICLREYWTSPSGSAGWSAALVADAIRGWARQHGRTPTLQDSANNPMLPSQGTATRFYGSWTKACRAAGCVPNPGSRSPGLAVAA